MFAYPTEICVLDYLLIDLLELLVVVCLSVADQDDLIEVLLLDEPHVLVRSERMLCLEGP